ncbi:MAG: LiaF domain-containing protein [Bacteroidales bacterium]
MRNLFTSGSFWGIFLIVFGALLVLRQIVDIHLPIGKIIISLLFIFFGIALLTGSFGHHRKNNAAVFSESEFQFDKNTTEYSSVFGQGTLDLRDITLSENININININAVFGEMRVLLRPETNYLIRSNAVFGSVNLPGKKSNSGFGESNTQSENFNKQQPHIIIKADAVFGSIDIRH